MLGLVVDAGSWQTASAAVVIALPMLEGRVSRVDKSKKGYAVDWDREWVRFLAGAEARDWEREWRDLREWRSLVDSGLAVRVVVVVVVVLVG
jgi:hypothetical protein